MSDEQPESGQTVALWCHVCQRFVEHHAAFVDNGVRKTRDGKTRKLPRVLHVTPAVLAKHRETHGSTS
ncbi:hypothetical protein ABRQ22_06755 [Cellulosimicrobium sp. ES-005]|uniref:Uncharacterized protein n=1 Tax=Cellulosimicrobium sp. ES-005 TaxID=3163031 RepID=A0AAU8G6N4_9MICO